MAKSEEMDPRVVFEWDENKQTYLMRTEGVPGITLEQQEKLLQAVHALNGWEASAASVDVHVEQVRLKMLPPKRASDEPS